MSELDEQEQAALTAVFAGYNVLIAKDTIAEKAFKAGRAYRPELPEEREALERVQAILFSGASKEMVRVVWNAARDFFRPAPGGVDELSVDARPDDIEINEQCLDRLREKEAGIELLRGALSFYGDEDNWIRVGISVPQERRYPVLADRGKRAREALAVSPSVSGGDQRKCRAPHCWSEYGTPCGECPEPSVSEGDEAPKCSVEGTNTWCMDTQCPVHGEPSVSKEQLEGLRETRAVLDRVCRIHADPECGECQGDGIDWEAEEWAVCDCVLKRGVSQEQEITEEPWPEIDPRAIACGACGADLTEACKRTRRTFLGRFKPWPCDRAALGQQEGE